MEPIGTKNWHFSVWYIKIQDLTNISKSETNQRLKFEPLEVSDILKMMHGLDGDFGPHNNQKLKTLNPIFTMLEINGWELFAILSWSIINQATKSEPLAVSGLLKSLNSLGYSNGAHNIPQSIIYYFGSFCKYLKVHDDLIAAILCDSRCRPLKHIRRLESLLRGP